MVDVNTLQSYLEDIKHFVLKNGSPIIRTVMFSGLVPLIDELVMENASLAADRDFQARQVALLRQMLTE